MKKIFSLLIVLNILLLSSACSSTEIIEPDFKLLGSSVINIHNGEEYIEPGFIATINQEDITDSVTVSSDFDIYTTGEYTITYTLEHNGKTYVTERTVHVGEILIRYFNQTAPGLTPKIFAEDIISTQYTSEFSCTFSPDYKYFFFTRRNNYSDNRLFYSEFIDGEWLEPQLSPISEELSEFEPHITPDGKYLYFGSKRNNTYSLEIFQSTLVDGVWDEPIHVDNGLNDGFAMYISVANNQNLYFTSATGISVMKYIDGAYIMPVSTGIQGAHSYISPDESYMLFDDSGQDKEYTSIYITYNEDGVWSTPIKLPESINKTDSNQICSMISPDGKYLFFSRFTSGRSDIYWVDIDILNNIKE